MKKIYGLLVSALLCQTAFGQQNIEGDWQGKLSVANASLRLVVHIKNDNGNYSATMDSPDQGAKGIPFSSVQVKGDSLLLEAKSIGGKFSGRFNNDTTLTGQWFQGTGLPLQLKKMAAGETVAEPRRPQTPKPPFPYKSEDVVYFNKEKSIQYGATITLPQGNGPFPAVVLITGSGQQNRDEELFGHKPFAVLADYLTRKGYVVMRVDDRGVGQTTGDVKNATSKDFANDVMTSLDYLKAMPQVNKTKVGLLGHSEGGMIAQLVAAERKDLAFVIMHAGPGQPILDLMTEQNRLVLTSTGMPAESVQRYSSFYKGMMTVIASASSDSAAVKLAAPLLDDWMDKTPKETVVATTGIKSGEGKAAYVNGFVKQVRSPWFHYFIQYNPGAYVQKMKAKVLALNGDKDIQVPSKENLSALKASLQKGGNKSFETVELKGLNHLFQHCQKCTVAEYAELEETMAPEALETIGAWLNKNVK